MKMQKMVSFDSDVIEGLRKLENASEVLNALAKDYLMKWDINMMTPEQLKKELEIEELKLKVREMESSKRK